MIESVESETLAAAAETSSGLAVDGNALLHTVLSACVSIALKLVASLIVFIIGRALIRFVLRRLAKGKRFEKMNPTARNFLHNMIKATLWTVLAFTIVGIMGIEMASILTVLASAGAAVALALQGSLSNFASGVMILIFKPFQLNDFVEVGSFSGNVIDVGIFYTTLLTPDNRHVVVPNSTITGGALVNYSMEKNRRVDIAISVSLETETELVKETVKAVAAEDKRILKAPEPFVRLVDTEKGTKNFTVRVWCEAGNYWDVKFELTERVNRVFAEKGIAVPAPQLEVRMKEDGKAN